ncbi:WD40 repeat-containing protein [Cylindrospermum stagnale PCC 7417]|uniref:WD40 repeat-containing protein n=1 Tax=Cylindrospermum stagnale PCC 7417 TaxID=56107 RepID=K9WT13_9NOST|nr:hypothetical protein [Cylindrospermum stagnale]AFZ22944.1 WD40 repeat-containing protein [Cylindrospermum stagnale PCC 7417]
MTDLQQNANEKALQQLAWAIEGSQGKFKLILAKCNYVSLRDRLIARLPEICKLEISVLYVQESARTLYSAIREEVGDGVQAMMVVGLDSLPGLPQMLTADNQVREEFRKNFAFPLVLWINDDVHKRLMELAPDLESWATTRNFAIAPDQLIDFLQQTAKQLLHNHLTLTLEKSTEIKSAWQDLQTSGQILEPESKANCNFLLGFVAFSNYQLDSAISNYQQSLTYWQAVNNLKLQFKILSHITYCHYKQAKQLQNQNTSSILPSPSRGGAEGEVSLDWQATKKSLQQCLELLKAAESPDLGTYLIDNFGGILQDLQYWETLETLANNALSVHQAEGNQIKIAQDYGYLAEVALARKNRLNAKELAEKALIILARLPNQETDKLIILQHHSSSLFILSQAHRNLNQYQAAINNLETAKKLGVTGNNAHFYIKILNNLQLLLFQQKQYLQAFDIKLERRSIEQQFGLRAFIGAGWLQTIKQAFLDGLHVTSVQENLALEIAASGRQLDVERLIERIARPDYKLIAIYGQSGVGKSSLVNAGLVPALKKKAIGIQDNLPVVMRVYTNWAEELGRLMVEALQERGRGAGGGLELGTTSPKLETTSSKLETPSSKLETTSSKVETSSSKVETPSLKLETPSSKVETSSSKVEKPTRNLTPQPPSLRGNGENSKPLSSQERGLERGFPDSVRENGENSKPLSSQERGLERGLPDSVRENGENSKPLSSQERGLERGLPDCIVAQLRENEQRNLRTVLVFDQFEEFFFVYPEPKLRRQFFEFLGECLNVLSVKVVLSLRVDYLHYLLECASLSTMKIIGNDILCKNVLYELGNFSPTDAKSVIERLTASANFHLEPALVDQLVQDLAGELGEVRPIELQVVGAQLQTENIRTLAKYQECGTKEELVKRYLDEVVNDCGAENQPVAELLLYLLTDEKGTRPLKTRAELERDLQALTTNAITDNSKLDLVLEIFVKSGLVLLLPENPADRYQLVHDYLALFIRQQQHPKLNEVLLELERERKQRKISEAKLNIVLKQALVGSIATGLMLAGLTATAWNSARQADEQRKKAAINEINALNNSSSAFFASAETGEALIEGLKAYKKLKLAPWAKTDTQMLTVATLRQAVYLPPKEQPETRAIEVNTLEGHSSTVNSVVFSPDGKTVASGSYDNTIKLWDVTTGKTLKTLTGHSSYVRSVVFSPDGKTVASGSYDNTIKLWDLTTGKTLKTLTGHSDSVFSVVFSPDGKTVASGSGDNTIKLWDLTTGKTLKTLTGHSSGVTSVGFSPDGKTVASGSYDKTIKLWDLTTGKALKTLTGHSNLVLSVGFSPDGKTVASGSSDKTIKLWDLTTGKTLKTLTGHSSYVNSVGFSPDGKTVASGSDDKTIKLWDLTTGKTLKTLTGHSSGVNSVVFSPDGKTVASGSSDKTIKLWDLTTGKTLKTLTGHSSYVLSAVFSPDGKTVASGSDDNSIKLWDVSTGKTLKTLTGHSSSVLSVVFNPDGKTVASGSGGKTIILWDLDLNELVKDSCHLLNNYLVTHPEVLEELKDCQTQPILVKAASVLLLQGEKLARIDDIDAAIAKFRKAQRWDSNSPFDPVAKAQEFANKGKAERLITEGESLVTEGKVKEALAAYADAQKLDSQVEISADSWGALCRYGSLNKKAPNVLFACENAVKLAPDNVDIRDSRGLARALTGNTQGAIEDFEALIAQTDDKDSKSQRQAWVKALRAGKNPFTDAELKKLQQ